MVGLQLGEFMVHVLEAGLTFLEANNPNNRPSVKGFNIINGQLAESSDGATFESRNPAILRDVLGAFPLSTKDDVNAALDAAHAAFPAWAATPAPTTKTFAAGIVPAAVIIIGIAFSKFENDSITALYPAKLA